MENSRDQMSKAEKEEVKKKVEDVGVGEVSEEESEATFDEIRAINYHRNQELDRKLKAEWSKRILTGLFIYGFFNYLLIVFYGFGVLEFADEWVIRIFLGGNVAAIPTLAVYITKNLFPGEKK